MEALVSQDRRITPISRTGPFTNPVTIGYTVSGTADASDYAALSGSVTDNGLPGTPGVVTSTWSLVDGPGSTLFDGPSDPATNLTLTEPDLHTLRLKITNIAAVASAGGFSAMAGPAQHVETALCLSKIKH